MDPVVYLTPSCGLRGKLIPKPTSTEETEGRDVYNFLGVPYAEPPVGNLRYCDPKPVSLWSGVRSATEFGAVCPQDFSVLDVLPVTVSQPRLVSENCLFLNVWTPSLDFESRLPVMVWIYGGSFLSGYSDLYDVKELACYHNVVVVTFNYRVASFGFLSVNDESATGNYGILDQIEALKWVQQYISRFGGDPTNVTIFGESAGSVSVSLLVISPLAKGLFRRAIAQSGTLFSGDFGCQTLENAFTKTYAHMANAGSPPSTAGSEIVAFLRRQSAEDLVTAFRDHQFTPVIDGRVFPANTAQLYESGNFNDCELIVGCNSDEGQMMYEAISRKHDLFEKPIINVNIARTVLTDIIRTMWTVPNGEPIYEAIVDNYIEKGDVTDQITLEELRKAMAECFGDFLFVFPTIRAANCHSRQCKTFVYQFCHRPPCAKYPDYARADHFSEVFYALRLLGFGLEFNEDDAKLSREMATYWTNFAKTGNPNGEGLEEWPEYHETTGRYMMFDLPSKSKSKMRESRADFWLNELPKLLKALPQEPQQTFTYVK